MSLANLIAGGVLSALNIVKQYVGAPTIVFNGLSVPIQAYRYVPKIEADVSRKVLVDMTGKKLVTDNVAPGPHEWRIEGYVGGFPVELSSLFMPSLGIMRDRLDQAFLSRQPLDFYDADQKAWTLLGGNPVLITSLEFEKAPDTENRLIVRIDLRELRFLTAQITSVNPQDVVAATATAPDGTATGAPESTGAHEAVSDSTTTPTSSWAQAASALWGKVR